MRTYLCVLRWMFIFSMAVGLCGCLLRPDVDPKPLAQPPNTFTAGSFFLRGKVYGVEVYESCERESRLVWRIASKEGVPAEGFAVTVGLVPAGFIQTVPPADQVIQLTRGQKYRIYVWPGKWPEDVEARGTAWIAE